MAYYTKMKHSFIKLKSLIGTGATTAKRIKRAAPTVAQSFRKQHTALAVFFTVFFGQTNIELRVTVLGGFFFHFRFGL